MAAMKISDDPKVSFNYRLIGTGWAQGNIIIGDQKMSFKVSYLSDPLTDLLEALIAITPVYVSSFFNSSLKVNHSFLTWYSEPMAYEWEFNLHSNTKLNIKVRYYDADVENDKGKVLLKVSCNYLDILRAVIDCLSTLINWHGFIGYYETWAGKASFPVAQFIMLKHFLMHEKSLKPRCVKVPGSKGPCNYVYTTLINDDIKTFSK